MQTRLKNLEKKLHRQLRETCRRYDLLAPGDRIAVGVSGGKDSYTLFQLLSQLKQALPFEISILGLHLDQQQPGYDGAPLRDWLHRSGVPFQILSEDTYSVVMDHVPEGRTYCSLCSRLRRGVLYTSMERLGYNKLALGHHREDALETFLMNVMFSGRMQAMPAKYTTDDGRFEVLRPLIECSEEMIAEYAQLAEFPILPCNLCGSQAGLKRQRMKRLLSELEQESPQIRGVMLNALRNVRPSHLLDQDVARAWRERDPEIRPEAPMMATKRHMAGLPVGQAGSVGDGRANGTTSATESSGSRLNGGLSPDGEVAEVDTTAARVYLPIVTH